MRLTPKDLIIPLLNCAEAVFGDAVCQAYVVIFSGCFGPALDGHKIARLCGYIKRSLDQTKNKVEQVSENV